MRTAFHSSLEIEAPSSHSVWLSPPPPREQHWIHRKSRTIAPLANLIKAVNKAQSILTLPDDWDDAGSPAIRPETLRRAVLFLLLHAAVLWGRYSVIIPTPRISAGPDGSIDLHWRTRRRELLVSIPQDLKGPAPYYGDNFGTERRKGTIPANALDLELFAWLAIVD
jgi:hypothetical protein